MDRLTKKETNGAILKIPASCNVCNACAPAKTSWPDCCDRCSLSQSLNRLAAYEDIGLTPEEVEELKVIKWWSQCGDDDLMPTVFGVSVDRLRALAEADREGRCVVPNEPVSKIYKSKLSEISELLENAAKKIEARCREWMCIYYRASNDTDQIKGDIGLTAYKECLKLVDSIGQKCSDAEAALAGEEETTDGTR